MGSEGVTRSKLQVRNNDCTRVEDALEQSKPGGREVHDEPWERAGQYQESPGHRAGNVL